MIKTPRQKTLILTAFSLFTFASHLFPQGDLRYFDQVKPASNEIRLAIFHNSSDHLKSLIVLKQQEIFSPKNLVIISVFHEKRQDKYEESFQLVKDQNITWIKFHKLSKDINKDNLFQQNKLTSDFEKIFARSDGVIFFGGDDIPPYLYGEKTHLLTDIETPYRHFLELSFAFHLLVGFQDSNLQPLLASAPEFPVLGICLGAQTLNVATGGTMVQHVWSEVYGKKYIEEVIAMPKENWHENPWYYLLPQKDLLSSYLHPIRLVERGKFVRELGFDTDDMPLILSSHHQALERLGKGLNIIATSLDGKIAEAIEHEKYPHVLGVQYHPESLKIWDKDRKFKTTIKDNKKIHLLSVLEGHPPSLTFHKKIWSWFASKLKQYHAQKQENLTPSLTCAQ